jgi:hypothetical protein
MFYFIAIFPMGTFLVVYIYMNVTLMNIVNETTLLFNFFPMPGSVTKYRLSYKYFLISYLLP